MSTIKRIKDWTPNQADEQPSQGKPLDILLGIRTRLDEILITGLLKTTAHRVHVVDSGLWALQSLNDQPFDLCFLSYEMADLSGPETTKVVRSKADAFSDIPIIGLLDHDSQIKSADCLQSGMNSVISAPITAEKIFSFIHYYTES